MNKSDQPKKPEKPKQKERDGREAELGRGEREKREWNNNHKIKANTAHKQIK